MRKIVALVCVAGLAGSVSAQPADAAAAAEAARARVATLEAELAAAQAALASAESQLTVVAPDAAEPAYTPSWLEGWTGSVSAGLNGSDGNTQQLAFRVAAKAVRTTEKIETTVGASYQYANSDGTKSESRAQLFGRNDWLVKDSRWRYFVEGKYEYDEFQDWDHRLSGFAGVGYEFIQNDKTSLIGRAGIGGSYEIGGMDEEFKPEALFGLDLAHKLTDRQRLTASTTIYPDLSDFNEFRMVNTAGWEITVDPETNMFLRLGAEHRHDSDPGMGFKNNDLDYYLTLGWDF